MPKHQWKLIVVWLWLSACGSMLYAAELTDSPYTVESWSNEEGLPQSSVISVIQSRDGYLWLGTLKGLVRFDGNKFSVFNGFSNPGLNSDQIVFLFEDSQTNLWVGTDNAGVVRIQNGRIENVNLGPTGHESRLISACEDTNGAVWLYTADARLARYQSGKLDTLHLFQSPAISRMITFEPAGSIWISEYEHTVAGMFSFRPDNFHPPALPIEQNIRAERMDYILGSRNGGVWRLMNGWVQKWTGNEQDFGPYPWTSSTVTAAAVTAACEDNEGNLVVGTPNNGVYWFDAQGNYRHISRSQGLSSDFILSLCVDREGDLWVGTDGGGLNRVRKNVFLPPAGLSPLPAQSVARDEHDGLWTAFNANGVTYWRTNVPQHFGAGLGQNAWTVLVDHQQHVWAGTRGEGLFELQNGQFLPAPGSASLGRQIFTLFEDHQGQLWAGTESGLAICQNQSWKIYTTSDGLPENIIRAIVQDPAGNYWIGTENQGLCSWSAGKFTPLAPSENGPPGNDISALFIDREGTFWVGTSGHGLACLKNGRWKHFSTKDGLASNSISYIIEDDAGDLWIDAHPTGGGRPEYDRSPHLWSGRRHAVARMFHRFPAGRSPDQRRTVMVFHRQRPGFRESDVA